jgi:predicted nucleic acid-binding protein
MNTVIESFRIYELYQFSHWDCLIVAAAIESDCEILYTEDLSDGQIIDKSLKIINPFIHNDIVNILIS